MPVPMHPSAMETPPQERVERRTTPENIRKFFDPTTYQNQKRYASGAISSAPQAERHTTPANIRMFFDLNRYTSPCQKRPAASEASSSAPPSSKPRTMDRDDLVAKFKLAAQLNGVSWDEIAVPSLYVRFGQLKWQWKIHPLMISNDGDFPLLC